MKIARVKWCPPRAFDEQQPAYSYRHVFRALDELGTAKVSAALWMGRDKILDAIQEREGYRMPVRTFLVALKWLREQGWIAQAEGIAFGKPVEIIWCLWLLAPEDMARERAHNRALSWAFDHAPDAQGPAHAIAQGPAPFKGSGLKTVRTKRTVSIASASPGGGRELQEATPAPTIDPEPPPSDPAPTPPPDLADPPAPADEGPTADECAARLDDPALKLPIFAAAWTWRLVALGQGDRIPARWKDRMGPRPDEPDGPSRRDELLAASDRAARAAAARPEHDQIRRVRDGGRKAPQAVVKSVAYWLSRRWEDDGWYPGWVATLGRLGDALIPMETFLDLFDRVDRSKRRDKGRMFNGLLDLECPGLRPEAIP